MKAIFFSAVVLLGLVGCGKPAYVDPTFQPFLDSFQAEAKARGIDVQTSDIRIVFWEAGPTDVEGLLGQCNEGLMGTPRVQIVQELWLTANDVQKESLLFHELGHCLLSRDHLEGPTLMATDVRSVEYKYHLHREEFLDELFGKGVTL